MKKTLLRFLISISCTALVTGGTYAQWSALVSSTDTIHMNAAITTLCTDPSGYIYASGYSTNSFGAHFVAKWSGTGWRALGFGDEFSRDIYAICSDNSGNIYATGTILYGMALIVSKWAGQNWNHVGGVNFANSFLYAHYALCSDASGYIYAAGTFSDSTNNRFVNKFDYHHWNELGAAGSIVTGSIRSCGDIQALCTDPNGNIYAAGHMNTGTGTTVAMWDGTGWYSLGEVAQTAHGFLTALCADSFGHIYTTGSFPNSNGHYYVAQWDGFSWSELGGMDALHANSMVSAICSDAMGNIYAAGHFTNGQSHFYVAKWDGQSWNELGGNNSLAANAPILALLCDAAGNIYAAGDFTDSSGYRYVAKYNSHPAGLRDFSEDTQARLYPTFNEGSFTLEAQYPNSRFFTVYDMTGQIVAHAAITAERQKISLPLANGMYMMAVDKCANPIRFEVVR